MREQNKAEPEILECTTSYHFLAFFVSGASLHVKLHFHNKVYPTQPVYSPD